MNGQHPDFDKIVLGIDPGTNVMGFGVIGINDRKMELIGAGVIKLDKVGDHALKLSRIFEECTRLIEFHKPDEVAIEAPFFGKNVQSMLKLGRAQGVSIAAAISKQIPVSEYSPKAIKQSITGNGNASKEQVAEMLKTLLKFSEVPKYLDATDGLAAAVCHQFKTTRDISGTGTDKKGWSSFIRNNPDKIV